MKEEFLLYHYTSEVGFRGILDSQCLWATHYSHLNDEEEIKDVLQHLRAFEKNALPSRTKGYFCNFIREVVEDFYLKSNNKVDFYITSFSDDKDSKNLWFEWDCSYAICFCPNELNRLLAEEEKFAIGTEYIRQVVYKAKTKHEILQAWKNEFNHVIMKANMNDNIARTSLASRAICLPALFKNPHRWSNQREWRIIIRNPIRISEDVNPDFWRKEKKQVHSNGSVKRLHLFNDPRQSGFSGLHAAIRGIVVGPTGNINFVREEMDKYGLGHIPITVSELMSA